VERELMVMHEKGIGRMMGVIDIKMNSGLKVKGWFL
jgi:hypothetical protein